MHNFRPQAFLEEIEKLVVQFLVVDQLVLTKIEELVPDDKADEGAETNQHHERARRGSEEVDDSFNHFNDLLHDHFDDSIRQPRKDDDPNGNAGEEDEETTYHDGYLQVCAKAHRLSS